MGVSIRSRKLASRSRSRVNVYGRLKPKRCASCAIHRVRESCARFWKGHREITYKRNQKIEKVRKTPPETEAFLLVRRACSTAGRCESSSQPDRGEVIAKRTRASP